ncbi:MAG TPA: FAD-dependent oxidoreductase [Bordetella sp.]
MKSIAVIGAGIVGLCTAANLQRKGLRTTLIDSLPPGTSTTYGNAGMISANSITPVAMPGMLRKVPKWLRDPEGPLFVDPKYLPSALPWLMRWIRAGASMEQVRRSSQGLYQLHSHALDEYKKLLGTEHFDALVKTVGQIHLWDSPQLPDNEKIAASMRSEAGIETRALSSGDLRDMLPELTSSVGCALYFPNNGHTTSPLRLAQTIHGLFTEAGGQTAPEKVLRIVPQGSQYRLWTNCGDHSYDQVVVAGGAWSLALLKPLGLDFPLETERGYHVQVDAPNIDLPYPILHKSRGFGASVMEDGLRLAGTVEIAGLRKPPNARRTESLLRHAKVLFPRLEIGKHKIWMGYRPSMPDSLPVLAASSRYPGLFIACGHGHTGITAGATTGRLMAEIVTQSPTFIDPAPYRLERFS